ncbi:MAG: hydroxyacid dehydrogenase [Ilumatobacteraceae bacterium]|nr:hydroxyacid dehydrogenase [Ilumatobacteraceae bacterium]
MSRQHAPRIVVGPSGAPEWLRTAVSDGGGELVEDGPADAIVWGAAYDVDGLLAALAAAPDAGWVQLPFAGIENFVEHIDRHRTWTCGKGVYAEPVAEIALALGLGGLRHVAGYTRASEWSGPQGRNLLGGRVTILGGGGITESLVRLLQPFGCHITVVRNRVQEMDGVDAVVGADRYADALAGADLVVLALALTPDTEGIIAAGELAMMESHAWLVNVARGRHVVTDDLVDALRTGTIGGAGLDVTDPEPLPADHPLWSLPNCVITPHVGNTPEMAAPLLAERIRANVGRFARGEPLIGLVDVDAGY